MDRQILSAVLDLTDDMLVLFGPDRRIRWMSKRAARISRVDAKQVVGKDVFSVVSDAKFERAVDRAVATGKPRQTLVNLGPDGVEAQARIVPIIQSPNNTDQASENVDANVSGSVSAVLVTFSELELEKRMQTMRREFVANVSHELRSPLTSILGYAETLVFDPPEDDEQRHRFLLSIVREARRMQRLVDDLLNLSRIESGRAAPQIEGVNLHNTVGRVLAQLRDQGERSGVRLENRVPPDLRLECDPGQMEQVVYNLVSNGIQYTPSGGQVVVSGWSENGSVFLRVTDTGVGIPPMDLPRVFERFYRVDKARSRATGATGLGLSIVKHIVDAHHGKVSVDSEPGAGASFTVELPATHITS